MNIFLWVLQILLALHTFIGAMWKFVNSEQSVASLRAMPHAVWLTLLIVELFCCVALVLPAFLKKPVRRLVPVAAACIVAEMLLFCAVQAFSGSHDHSQLIYWLVVAAISGFIVYGRAVLRPL
jgi:hypothetical protein